MSQTKRDAMERGFGQRLSCGRSLEEQIEDVRALGNHGASPVLRAGALASHGIFKPAETAENVVFFGCYRPFTTPFLLRDALRLLTHLGVEHTWLDKEYCCGFPLLSQCAGEDRPEVRAASREFIRRNDELARAKGAKKLAYCCAGCAYAARDAFPEARQEHVYILDLILDNLGQLPLRVAPATLGYFEGCHRSSSGHFPAGGLDWCRYRTLLDRIEGLRVVDLPSGLCCKQQAQKLLQAAAEHNLEAILCACSGCSATLKAAARGTVRIMNYPGLLAQALGLDPAQE